MFNYDYCYLLCEKMVSAEVECLQILRHPNIISYYGAWQEDSSFYILMEYAVRGTLKNLLDKRTSPLIEQVCVISNIWCIFKKKIVFLDYLWTLIFFFPGCTVFVLSSCLGSPSYTFEKYITPRFEAGKYYAHGPHGRHREDRRFRTFKGLTRVSFRK